MNLLEVNALGISFGGLKAVDNFHVSVKKNELYGLIGPNGAGKTTIFNLLTGVYKPNAGEILLNGKNLVGMSCIKINHEGVARTFQNIRLFNKLSVLDNVKAGYFASQKYSFFDGIFRLPNYFRKKRLWMIWLWIYFPFSIWRTWQRNRPEIFLTESRESSRLQELFPQTLPYFSLTSRLQE